MAAASPYVYVAQGTKGDFNEVAEAMMSDKIPPGTWCELQLHFSGRFWGFENQAIALDDKLRTTEVGGKYMPPWAGNYQVVYVDPHLPIWYIRYIRGHLWIVAIAAAVLAISIAWAAFVIWKMFKYLAEKFPYLIPIITTSISLVAAGFVATSLIRAFTDARRTPQTVTTTYRRR